MQMHHAPFRFDRTFPDAPPPGPRLSGDAAMHAAALEAELDELRRGHDAALDEAWRQGHAAGTMEERQGVGAATLAALDALLAALEEVGAALDSQTEHLSDGLADVAVAAGEAIAGHALSIDPAAAVRANMRRLIDTLVRGTALTVRVHPALVPSLETHLAALQQTDRRRLLVDIAADDGITPGDACIDWDQGGCALSRTDRLAQVAAVFGAAGQPGK